MTTSRHVEEFMHWFRRNMNNSHCKSLKITSHEKKPPAVAGRNDHLPEMAFIGEILSLSLFQVESFFVKVNERNQPSLKLRQVKH